MWKHVGLCVALLAAACGDNSQSGAVAPTVVRIDPIAAGDECPAGGVAIVWGADDDGDGILDDNEVDKREVRCEKVDEDANLLTRRAELQPGEQQCEYGGEVVHTGHDADADLFLDDEEIESSTVICAAAPPTALVRVVALAPGMQCPDGGTRILGGNDLDADGVLDDEEVTAESIVCGDPVASPEVEVGAGYRYSCARKASGTVWCWGSNDYGRRGLPKQTNLIEASPVPSIFGATQLSVGSDHACAVDGQARVQCWGSNFRGMLGDTGADGGPRVVPLGGAAASKVDAGSAHTCAIVGAGKELWCWGNNESGEVTGVPSSSVTGELPAKVAGVPPVVDVSVGGWTTCAVTTSGEVWCWGGNEYGQAGAPIAETVAPAAVSGLTNAVAVDIGSTTACALLADGSVHCWGANYMWQLGDEGPDRATPVAIALPAPAVEIAVGGSSSCATLNDGSTRCWGNNGFGKLGQGTFSGRSLAPLPIAGFYGATSLSSGIFHSCVIRGGEPWCWGNNYEGESSGTVLQGRPVQVLTDVEDVEVGFRGSCARRSDNTAWCWGSFGYGDQHGTWYRTPARVTSWTDVVDIAVGRGHACLLRSGGALWCWGTNSHGELADGTTTQRDYLVPSSVKDVVAVEAGGTQTCAIRSGGQLWCWGYAGNDFGNGSPPHAMGTLSDVIDVRLSAHNGCAIDSSHRLWCWGENDDGEVPGAIGSWVTAPVQVMTNVAAVMPSSDRVCAIKLDGTEWCWGLYYFGGPTQIDTVGVGAFGTGGLGHECVARNGDALWCRGSNWVAQIGDGTLDHRTMPVDTGLRGIVDVSSEWLHTCAANAAGSLWCWGRNEAGQIGAGGQAGMVSYPARLSL